VISYGRQDISQQDIDAVVEVLRSDFLTQGPKVPEFEQQVARYCGAGHGVAVNSATSALHIACMALGIESGDIVWTSSNTFVASANCARYCGADVDFVDIDPLTWNLCPDRLAKKLDEAEKSNRLPKVVIPVHLCGQSCDMAAIHALAQRYRFRIIEDASHAIGGLYRDQPVGNCRYSDITVFSFHPVKIITTAEGGMAMTNSEELAMHMTRLRTHGITRDSEQMKQKPIGSWYYEQLELGFNYRMTDLQAALGISQFSRLNQFVERRNFLATRYDKFLNELPVKRPSLIEHAYSSWHLYPVRLQLENTQRSHREVFEGMRAAGIGVNVHYIPVHLQPYYQELGFREKMFPMAEAYGRDAISLPMFPLLSDEEQVYVVNTLAELLA